MRKSAEKMSLCCVGFLSLVELGFVGNHLVDALASRDFEVLKLDVEFEAEI
jgi:hypothetical protein